MLAFATLPARADTLRAVVRLAGPEDRALFERMRGQASDLAVTLEALETAALEPSLREQLATAHELAAAREAQVVIWATRAPDLLEIVVADLALDRVLVRALENAHGPEQRSAQDEAAALVVRSALKASLSGEALGSSPTELLVEEPTPAPEPGPQLAPPQLAPPQLAPPQAPPQLAPPQFAAEPAPQLVPPQLAPPQKPAPRAPQRWLVALGVLAGGDGVSRAGRYAVSGRVGVQGRRYELGLRGALGMRAEARVALARLALAQHRLEAYVGVAPIARDTLRLALLAGAGARVFSLRVRSSDEGLAGESGRKVLVGLSALVTLRWLPTWAGWEGGRAGVACSAGVDVLPRALELGYRVGSSFVGAQTLWRAQPVAALEGVLLF